MKIAVITRHSITNYGSLLQSIATQKILEKLGHECKIINYIRHDEEFYRVEKTLLKNKKWNKNIIKKIIYLTTRQPEVLFSGIKFKKFQEKYLNLTPKYSSKKELLENIPEADVYMTGSDQVWGPVSNGQYDDVYCLSFVEEGRRKIAYASSFGIAKLDSQLSEYYKKWISRYDSVNVREENAVSMLKEIGIESNQVLDPTLLFDKNDWSEYLEPLKEKSYILVYQLHNDKRLGEYAEKLARRKQLKLIRISPTLHQIVREGSFRWLPSVGKFLSYIKNAECMITDSFHGTAFAINFNTPFIEILPNNNTGSRNVSILNLTGLNDRLLNDYDNFDIADKEIDFDEVNRRIENQRNYSIKVLNKII